MASTEDSVTTEEQMTTVTDKSTTITIVEPSDPEINKGMIIGLFAAVVLVLAGIFIFYFIKRKIDRTKAEREKDFERHHARDLNPTARKMVVPTSLSVNHRRNKHKSTLLSERKSKHLKSKDYNDKQFKNDPLIIDSTQKDIMQGTSDKVISPLERSQHLFVDSKYDISRKNHRKKKKKFKRKRLENDDSGEELKYKKIMKRKKIKSSNKSNKVFEGEASRVIILITSPHKATKILKSEERNYTRRHKQKRKRHRSNKLKEE